MAPPRLCEDVLRKILAFLMESEYQEGYGFGFLHSVILRFMLVGHSWLEVGRERLYQQPVITASSDAAYLFQSSILYHNHSLGTYVRAFDGRGIGLGNSTLARMVWLMSNLSMLISESLDFVEYWPESDDIPCFTRPVVVAPDFTATPPAFKRRTSSQLLIDDAKLNWLLVAREVQLSGLDIRTEISRAPWDGPFGLRKLTVDRCSWDFSTCAGVIPQLAWTIADLQICNFGLNHKLLPSRKFPPSLATSNYPCQEMDPTVVEAMLPVLYGLSRHITTIRIQYTANAVYYVGPDLGLLSSEIQLCDVSYQNSYVEHLYAYRYPPNTRNLHIRVHRFDQDLLSFIEDLGNADHLKKLVTAPGIWIRAPTGPGAGERDLRRGLSVSQQPSEMECSDTCFYVTEATQYRSFWTWPFTPSTETTSHSLGEVAGETSGDVGT